MRQESKGCSMAHVNNKINLSRVISVFSIVVMLLVLPIRNSNAERGKLDDRDKKEIIEIMKEYPLEYDEKHSRGTTEYCSAFLRDFSNQTNITYPEPLLNTNDINEVWRSPYFSNCEKEGYGRMGAYKSEPHFELFKIKEENNITKEYFILTDSGFVISATRIDDYKPHLIGRVKYRFFSKESCLGKSMPIGMGISGPYAEISETDGKDYTSDTKHAVIEYNNKTLSVKLITSKSKSKLLPRMQVFRFENRVERWNIICLFRDQ